MFKKLRSKLSQRRNEIIEGRIKEMVYRAEGYAVFSDIYFESARGYAVDRGAKAADATSASTRVEIDGKSYSVVFSKSAGGGTVFGIEDAHVVRDRLLNPAKMRAHYEGQMDRAFAEFGAANRYDQAERLIAKDIENSVVKHPTWVSDKGSIEKMFETALQAALKGGMSEPLALQWLGQKDLSDAIITSAAHFEKVEFSKAEQIECVGQFTEKLAKAQIKAQMRAGRPSFSE
jgi:hypothetical protein